MIRAAAVVCCALAGAAAASGLLGLRLNTTASVPVGFYLAHTSRAPVVGDYVFLCPPDTPPFRLARDRGYLGPGPCPGDYEHMFKLVLAAKTDIVSVTAEGVAINGRTLPNSAPLTFDAGGRPLPVYRRPPTPLGALDVLLMTDQNPRSFDARYFGPVESSQIEAVVTPLFTW